MRKIAIYILGIIALTSLLLATGIKEVENWWDIAKPFFLIYIISIVIALTPAYINQIRRITYPVFVCTGAWVYKHKMIRTDFTKKTYKLYQWQNRSYRNLFDYVQDLFDKVYATT